MSIRKIIVKDKVRWEVRSRQYEDGKNPKRIKRTFDRKTDAENFEHEFEEEQRKKVTNIFKGCDFDKVFEDEAKYWLERGSMRFSASHLVRVKGILSELLPKYGKLKMDRFTPDLLTSFQLEESKKGLANATVNRKTEVITSILNFSAKQRRIPYSPAIGFSKLNKAHAEMHFWEKDEAESFLAFTNRKYFPESEYRWVHVVYLLALNTALRSGEIWGLRPSDISSDEQRILVRRQFEKITKDFAVPKGKKARPVPCNEELHRELMNHIKRNKIVADETIFMKPNREPIEHGNFVLWKFFKDLREWRGRPIRFHDLRHTATTLLIASGVDLKTVKEICGHAKIETTMEYAHLVSGSIGKVASTFSISGETERRSKLALIQNG